MTFLFERHSDVSNGDYNTVPIHRINENIIQGVKKKWDDIYKVRVKVLERDIWKVVWTSSFQVMKNLILF